VLTKVSHVQTEAERIIEAFGEAIMRRDFEALAELLHDDLSYETCGIDLEGAGVFDKPTILARLPQVLTLFEDGGPRMTITSRSATATGSLPRAPALDASETAPSTTTAT
jgi:hypothetical protein